MKRLSLILIVLFSQAMAFAKEMVLIFQDKDTLQGLDKVSVILMKDGKRDKLGSSDGSGKVSITYDKKATGNKVMFFRKGYKKECMAYEDIMKQKEPLLLQEKMPPLEVKNLRVLQEDGKTWLVWDASASPDTDYYQIYYREGLNPYQRLKDKYTSTRLEIVPLEEARDYYFQVKAQDKNKNKNKGTELHYYHQSDYPMLPQTASVSGTVSGLEGQNGLVIFYPVNLGDTLQVDAAPRKIKCDASGGFQIKDLPEGRYTVKAFADMNGNGAWDGNWLKALPEPRAILYDIRVSKKTPLKLNLKLEKKFTGMPKVIYDESPGYIDLYQAAWQMARAKITPGHTENGFVTAYMDEGFNNHIYQWDTCFMMFFGIYGGDDFPAMNSLDNFYLKQRPNGYICRVQNEDTGKDYDPSLNDPSVNPPLYAWLEWTYLRVTGDDSRLLWALTHLDRYYHWLKNNVRREGGWYFTSNLGSGMDNSPREGQAWGWVDMTAQMALFADRMAALARQAGIPSAKAYYEKEYQDLSSLINTTMWDEDKQIYFDVKKNSSLHRKKTIASFWPMLARIVSADRLKGLVSHLENPAEFKTLHVFPTLARDEAEYDPKGYYWRGGVWAPTTFMVIKGLEANGLYDLARRSALNHVHNMWKIYQNCVPDKNKLPYKESNIPFPAHLDGTKQIWELYSPEKEEPGTRWDNQFYGRPEFVGWSGVGPIVLFIENILGIVPDALSKKIVWRVNSGKKHGIQGLGFLGGRVDLVMEGIKDGQPSFTIHSSRDFELEVWYLNKKRVIPVTADL